MSGKFYNPLNLPVVADTPATEPGFAKLYGRDGDFYALFPDGSETLLNAKAGEQVFDNDMTFLTDVVLLERTQLKLDRPDTLSAEDVMLPLPVLPDTVGTQDTSLMQVFETQSPDTVKMLEATRLVMGTDEISITQTDTRQAPNIHGTEYDVALVADSRGVADITQESWADTVVINDNFSSPELSVDLDDATDAFIRVQESGGIGSESQQASGSITLSLANTDINPTPSMVTSFVEYGWIAENSPQLQDGNGVVAEFEYSIDSGATFQPLSTVSVISGSAEVTFEIFTTYENTNKIMVRLNLTLDSGTIPAIGGGFQQFGIRYARCSTTSQQTL
jgi:hypothetical protein